MVGYFHKVRSYLFLGLVFCPGINLFADVRLTGMQTADFGVWSGGDLVDDNVTCVYRSDGNDKYKLTVTDNSTITPGGFYLENESKTVQIPLSVRWKTSPVAGGNSLSDGVTKNLRDANVTNELCADSMSSNLNVSVSGGDYSGVLPGTYSTELIIFLEPR